MKFILDFLMSIMREGLDNFLSRFSEELVDIHPVP